MEEEEKEFYENPFQSENPFEEMDPNDVLNLIGPLFLENLPRFDIEILKQKSEAWERYKSYRDVSELLKTMIIEDPTIHSVNFEIDKEEQRTVVTIYIE